MDGDALRDAITVEMADYRRPKLQPCQTSYILRPVTTYGNSSNSLSADGDSEKYQPVTSSTANRSSSSQSEAPTGADVVIDVGMTGSIVKLSEVPRISAAKVEVGGNSVEMPSATREPQPDDVAMLSARRIADADVTLQAEICRDTSGSNNDRTDTTLVADSRTDSTVVTEASCTQSSTGRVGSNSLVVNTDMPQADDAKSRIKAALLNSGRRRQRLGEYTSRTYMN